MENWRRKKANRLVFPHKYVAIRDNSLQMHTMQSTPLDAPTGNKRLR